MLGDDNLYFYLTGSDHLVKIGNDEMKYHFDEIQKTFFACSKSENISFDETGHWYACMREGCNACDTLSEGNHAYYSDCDTTCDVCGYVRPNEELAHNTISDFVYDENGHWHECEECFGMFDYAEHIFDDDMTYNVCGYIRKFKVSKVEYEMSGYEYAGLVSQLVVSATDEDIISGSYSQAYIVCTDEGCLYYDFSSMVTDNVATFMEKQTYYLVVIIGSQTYDISTITKGNVTINGVGNPISLIYHSNYNYSYALFKLETLYSPHIHTGMWVREVPATCSQTGTKGHKTCDICGKYFDENGDEIIDLEIAIDEHAHPFGQ